MAGIRNIVKKFVPTKVFGRIEPIGHLFEAVIANIKYGFPSRDMHVIGITGTNGKTTTTFFIEKMLHEAGLPVAMLSTVAYGVGDEIHSQVEHITTAQSGILQNRLSEFKKQGVKWLVMETSSHSLAQYRIWGVPYEIAVMTNVTADHLDYHGTFDRYLDAKVRLFKIANKHGKKFGVVNADDPNAGRFVDSISRSITYGVNAGELRAKNVFLATDHSTFQVEIGDDDYNIHVNIPGEFNVSNVLAAIAVGREVGLNKEQIEQGIAALTDVEGRMTVIDEGQKFKVLVDFASTPDAFEQFFASVRPSVKGKLISVFGSAGRRDESKRAVQGEIAGKYSDLVIITEEDDRDVDGNEIMNQIAQGAEKSGKILDNNLYKILDRESAIKFALGQANNSEDMVVLLGKGHEKTIERADGVHPWNEIEITRKILQSFNQ
jgi:UDP-N-acetylmuramoyl-L-alanyl-D-glutamate--2,6-diaminopimelate ligase